MIKLVQLRDFRAADAPQVNRVALVAFEEFKSHHSDWPAMTAAVGRMATLAEKGEIIIAECDEKFVGASWPFKSPGRISGRGFCLPIAHQPLADARQMLAAPVKIAVVE